MTRKDSEKDSERPHYYSQFWLDIAAGRRVIGGPRPNEEADIEQDLEAEPPVLRKTGRSSNAAFSDGYEETISHPEVEPELDAEEYVEPELDETGFDDEDAEETEIPDVVVDETEIPDVVVDETEIPDVELAPVSLAPAEEGEEEDEGFFEEEEEEEEEDDGLGWGGTRGRKKPKPGRLKQPKKPKREPRRGF